MPGFFSQMPSPKAGRYIATVRTTSPFGPGRERHRSAHGGRLRAYLAARFVALWLDLLIVDESLGIMWRVDGDQEKGAQP